MTHYKFKHLKPLQFLPVSTISALPVYLHLYCVAPAWMPPPSPTKTLSDMSVGTEGDEGSKIRRPPSRISREPSLKIALKICT